VKSVIVENDDYFFGKIFLMMMQSNQLWEMNCICFIS
jgi:hypothetical protein